LKNCLVPAQETPPSLQKQIACCSQKSSAC
jgi:hypothetical protein